MKDTSKDTKQQSPPPNISFVVVIVVVVSVDIPVSHLMSGDYNSKIVILG